MPDFSKLIPVSEIIPDGTPLTTFRTFVVGGMDFATEEIAKWTERVARNPVNAFEWSQGAFNAAARLNVYGRFAAVAQCVADPDHQATLPNLVGMLRDDLLRSARSVAPSSSSATANLLTAMECEVIAGLVDDWERHLSS